MCDDDQHGDAVWHAVLEVNTLWKYDCRLCSIPTEPPTRSPIFVTPPPPTQVPTNTKNDGESSIRNNNNNSSQIAQALPAKAGDGGC